jgi:hypothetical protein
LEGKSGSVQGCDKSYVDMSNPVAKLHNKSKHKEIEVARVDDEDFKEWVTVFNSSQLQPAAGFCESACLLCKKWNKDPNWRHVSWWIFLLSARDREVDRYATYVSIMLPSR